MLILMLIGVVSGWQKKIHTVSKLTSEKMVERDLTAISNDMKELVSAATGDIEKAHN